MARNQRGDEEAIKYLAREEVERFFRRIPEERTRDLLLFDLIYRHGLRRSEAGLLALQDVRDGKIWIARRKHGLSGAYPLHPRSKELLTRYLEERPEDGSLYLLRSRRHGDGSSRGLKGLRSAFVQDGVDFVVSDLRVELHRRALR